MARAAQGRAALAAWFALSWRARLAPGESVLILGATGATGSIAAQTAKHLGAGRVTAAGRDPEALARTQTLGADTTIAFNGSRDELTRAFADPRPL